MSQKRNSTSTEGCSLCEGALIVTERTLGRDNDEIWTEEACPRCLSVPVDIVSRAFAVEWAGTTALPWDCCEPPWCVRWERGREFGLLDVVPLYTTAGMSLGVGLLAHEHGSDAVRLHVDLFDACDTRWDWPMDDAKRSLQTVLARRLSTSVDELMRLLLALPDAPPRLRAARLVALCLEVTL